MALGRWGGRWGEGSVWQSGRCSVDWHKQKAGGGTGVGERESSCAPAGAGGKGQGSCPGAQCGQVCTRAQCKGQGEGICATAQCKVRAMCTTAQCKGWGNIHHGSVQGAVGAQWLSAGDTEGYVPWLSVRARDVCHGSAQEWGCSPWLSAGCGAQGTCNVTQCKGRVTRIMTRHVGCVARAGAGAEPPGCTWHLLGPCRGRCSPWGSSRGAMWQHHSLAPVLHKDDVVESTTSRPLHTVGTYGEAEPWDWLELAAATLNRAVPTR